MEANNKNSGGQLNLIATASDADSICDWIRAALQREPIENLQAHADEVRIEVYFDSLLEAQVAKKALPTTLPVLNVEAREYQEQDWTTFWQHHFKTMELGKNLRIIPEWEPLPKDSKVNILINPGLSFGTGGHFTTKFCLEALESAITELSIDRMIDAGTGSGILSIAAIKLGIPSVVAFDYDPICIDQCHENADRNDITGKIDFYQADVLEPGWCHAPADLVCANILTSVLLEAAPRIKRAAKKRILLSGIREIEGDAVAGTFIELGCREVSRDGDGQWCGIVLDV